MWYVLSSFGSVGSLCTAQSTIVRYCNRAAVLRAFRRAVPSSGGDPASTGTEEKLASASKGKSKGSKAKSAKAAAPEELWVEVPALASQTPQTADVQNQEEREKEDDIPGPGVELALSDLVLGSRQLRVRKVLCQRGMWGDLSAGMLSFHNNQPNCSHRHAYALQK